MINNIEQYNKNMQLLINTIKLFKSSKGFYSSLWTNLNNMSDNDLQELNDLVSKYKWTDEVDVIFYLEG